MIIKRIKAFLIDQSTTLIFSFGIYYGWFIHDNGNFNLNYEGLFLCYIIAQTFLVITYVFLNNGVTPGVKAVKITIRNIDGSDLNKWKKLIYYLAYPIILINVYFLPYNLFFLILYTPIPVNKDKEYNLILSQIMNINFVKV